MRTQHPALTRSLLVSHIPTLPYVQDILTVCFLEASGALFNYVSFMSMAIADITNKPDLAPSTLHRHLLGLWKSQLEQHKDNSEHNRYILVYSVRLLLLSSYSYLLRPDTPSQ